MQVPVGVRTRIVTCGAPYPTIEPDSNRKLQLRVRLSSSRSLIWNGERLEKQFNVIHYGSPGIPAAFECVVTDMAGMIDADTMQLIDISGNAHTHLLTARLRVFLGTDLVWEDTKTFVVPTDDEPLTLSSDTDPADTDNTVIPDPVLGILVPFVGVTDERIASAVEEYMSDATLATPAFVEDKILTHTMSPTPHPAYDDMVDMTLIFENGLI